MTLGSDFSPGVSSAQAGGIRISRAPYPDGSAGITISLRAVVEKSREGRHDPAMIEWVRGLFQAKGLDGRDGSQHRAKMGAILDGARAAGIYTPDPHGSEVVQSPAATLCLRPNLCLKGGDCDDWVVVVISSLLIAGINCRIIKQRWDRAGQQHVLCAGQDEAGEWIRMDPSTRLPLGSSYPADEEVWIDPMGPVEDLAAAPAEIVLIGDPSGFAKGGGGGHGGGGHHGGGGGHGGGVSRRFHGGHWWDWSSNGWVIVQGTVCGQWGAPIVPSTALALFASRALASSGGQPVSETWSDGTVYLFSMENGAATVRPCVQTVASPEGQQAMYGELGRKKSGGDGLVASPEGELPMYGQLTPQAIPSKLRHPSTISPRAFPSPYAPRVPSPTVNPASTRLHGIGALGIASAADVQQLDSQVSGVMDATNTAVNGCSAMQPSDTQQWNGIYAGWQSWHADLQQCYSGNAPGDPEPPDVQCQIEFGFTWTTAYAKLASYQTQAQAWQQRVHNACPNYNPAPVPPPPNPPPPPPGTPGACDIACQIGNVAKYVGVAALTVAGAYTIYKIVEVASEASEASIAKRAVTSGVRRLPPGVAKRLGYAYENPLPGTEGRVVWTGHGRAITRGPHGYWIWKLNPGRRSWRICGSANSLTAAKRKVSAAA